jgi:hypothetical protein
LKEETRLRSHEREKAPRREREREKERGELISSTIAKAKREKERLHSGDVPCIYNR